MTLSDYQVRAVGCDYRASQDEIYAALKRAVDPLTRSWAKLRSARRIGIKFNQDWKVSPRIYEGHHQEHVSKQTARALLRLLRERTTARLFCAEVSFFKAYNDPPPENTTWLSDVFQEYDVEYVDWNQPPIVPFAVPGGGLMFDHYFLPEDLAETDALVSVQKMKNHAFMGITLCLKNLFGIMPTDPLGRPRHYYHHLVRMPYMLADIGRIFNPALNIIDALTSQAGSEWGSNETRLTKALVAGDHVVATDACGAYLMGHDPQADWLTPPFHRDRNAVLVAAQHGFGTVKLDEIDYQSEVQAPLGKFFSVCTDSQERVVNWRRTIAEQALYYRDHRRELVSQYAGEYILLQRCQVMWHDPSGRLKMSRRLISGDYPDDAIFVKYVDPDEFEGEHFEVYEQTLEQIKSLPPAQETP